MTFELAQILLIFSASFLLAYIIAFKETPELNGIKNATMYRVSYGLVVARGSGWLLFYIFGIPWNI